MRKGGYVTIVVASVIIAGPLAAAAEGPSLADLEMFTAPAAEMSPAAAELATKLQLVRALILGGKAEEALATLDEVAARDVAGKYTFETLYYRGFALDALGRYDAAVVSYDEALERRPGDATVLLAKGQAYLDAGRDDDARGAFEEVLSSLPEDSRALTGVAYLDIRDGDMAAAREKLERALAADAANALAMSYLGLVEMDAGRYDVARAHLENALELEPDNITANYNLAAIYFMQGNYAAAEGHYRHVLGLKADDSQARFYLALSLEAQGKYAQALEEADKVVRSGEVVGGVVEMVDRLEKHLSSPDE